VYARVCEGVTCWASQEQNMYTHVYIKRERATHVYIKRERAHVYIKRERAREKPVRTYKCLYMYVCIYV